MAVLNAASQIEDPIKNYAKESHDYLAELHPELATFMGGTYDVEGKSNSEGVWHKEERRHNPLFSKLFQQLTGHKAAENPNSVNDAIHSDDPRADVRRHGVSRVATECLRCDLGQPTLRTCTVGWLETHDWASRVLGRTQGQDSN